MLTCASSSSSGRPPAITRGLKVFLVITLGGGILFLGGGVHPQHVAVCVCRNAALSRSCPCDVASTRRKIVDSVLGHGTLIDFRATHDVQGGAGAFASAPEDGETFVAAVGRGEGVVVGWDVGAARRRGEPLQMTEEMKGEEESISG